MRTLLPPPPASSPDYSYPLASLAARILYVNPLPSTTSNLPLYILSAAALPSARTISFDDLLPYILARLPSTDDLISGLEYEIIFFAHQEEKKKLPGWQWLVQTYGLLSRVLRKRLKRLWVVGAEKWVRVLVEGVMTVVGTMKGRRKVVFLRGVEGLSGVGLDVRELCVPASVWVGEVRRRKRRKANEDVDGRTHGRRAFGVREPLPRRAGEEAERVRLPRLLREATTFLLMDECAKTEGLFRVNAKAVLVEALRDMYEKGQQFVVWKEKETVLCSAYWREGFGDVGVEEVEAKDGFDVHAAAGLVKMWYGELREPMFPQTCYQALQKFYGGDEVRLEPEQLVAMVREDAEWTILSTTARRILRMHLLPLLSRIVEFGEWNRMTASSLAVCFAPALLRGPDIEEDVKVMVIVRRLLEAMIANWKDHLAPAFDLDYKSFEDELRPPKAIADREDPLEEAGDGILSKDAQRTGITLLDNDASASDTQDDGNDGDEPPPLPVRSNAFPLREGGPPPLPPRPRTFSVPADERPSLPPRIRSSTVADVPQVSPRSSPSSSPTTDCDGKVKRKPAPTVQPLPRYSMVVGPLGQQPGTLEHIPFYNTVEVTADESSDLEQDPDPDLPGYEAMPGSPSRRTIPRKPVPMQGEKEAH